MVDSSIGLVTLIVLCLLVGVNFGLAALWVPVLLAILVAFTAGSALVVGCANLFFRDMKYIVRVLLSFGIFFTPVFFEPEMFGPVGARLMMLNPLAPILEGFRLSLVYDHNLLAWLIDPGPTAPCSSGVRGISPIARVGPRDADGRALALSSQRTKVCRVRMRTVRG